MNPVIYFRGGLAEEAELLAAKRYFRVVHQRTHVQPGELVIPRYSALPLNRELCEDLKELGAIPINSHRQHVYVADLKNWYPDLEGLTPHTWFTLESVPKLGGPFVVKGATNSRKFEWSTMMFARDKVSAAEVVSRLSQDGMLKYQDIYIRQYVPLRRLATGLNDLPITKEFRFFVLDGKVLASGYYWSSHIDDIGEVPSPNEVPEEFKQQVIAAVGDNIRFWVMDLGQTESGDWVVVELNDGQMSGLSEVDPDTLYRNLAAALQ